MNRKQHAIVAVVLAALASVAGVAVAEEGGSGHYLPGSMSSFIDAVPPTETFVTRLNVIYYKGSVGAETALPIGGLTALGADAKSWAFGLTLLWRPPVELGACWSYSMSATIPVVLMDVSANVATALQSGTPIAATRSSSTNGLGDLVVIPIMVDYGVSRDFHVEFRTAFYAPSGNYEVGRLANTGKNFWTFEPTLGLRYFGQKNGIEAIAFVGMDFNSENGDTNYKSGSQFHVDGTLAQHFPALGGLTGVGVNAYYYRQVTGDSGAGATLGSFEAKTDGLGPVLSYVTKIGGHDSIFEAKWLHELDTNNRLKGDIFWFKAVFKF